MPRTLLLMIALLPLAGGHPAAAEPPAALRVALLHGSYSNYRHRDDYDEAMKSLGWRLEKVENKNFADLAGRLDQFDLLLGTALFNYQENVQDFAAWRQPILTFLEHGGAVVLTDANYPTHVNWLAGFGADWAVGVRNCASTTTPLKWLDASHPVFSADSPVRALPAAWAHLEPAAGWQVLSRCADDGATAIFRTQGRGFVLVTSFWPLDAAKLRNVQATLQYTRAGLLPSLPALDTLTFGANTVTTQLRNLLDRPLTVRAELSVAGPAEPPPAPAAEVTVPAGQTAALSLPVRLASRGRYDLSFALRVDGGPAFGAVSAAVVLPPLIETRVTEPAYRGVIALAAPPPRVAAQVTLHPYEEHLDGARWQARLWRGAQVIAGGEPQPLAGRELSVSLPFTDTGTGDCSLEVSLLPAQGGPPLYSARTAIGVLASRPAQVFIDGQRDTRVDGRSFFPIAVYHVAAKDYPRVKALGFNTVQAWGSTLEQARANLDAAAANGLMVILEGVTAAAADGNLAALDPTIAAVGDHPALLAWYLTDEPSGEAKLAWCRKVYDYLKAKDPHHPVFMTSCSPGEFAAYAPVTDIFAVDPYPVPSAPVTMVSDWLNTAQTAVAGRQPVWLIPQLHNWAAYDGHPEKGRYPTPLEERNMVYQGLVWGAKAIFYYPWDDGPTGLVKDPELMAAVGRLNRELQQLGPELLACDSQVTAANTAPHAGLYAAVYRGARAAYVIAVNAKPQAATLTVPAPGLADATADVLFEDRQVALTGGQLTDRFEPLAVHVYGVK
jgi:hypothetical protein